MHTFKTLIALAVAITIGEAAVSAQPQLEVHVHWFKIGTVEGWWGNAKVTLLSDSPTSPEEMQTLLSEAIQEAVNQLPFAVEDWILSLEFFRGQERIAGTKVRAYIYWLDPIKVAGTLAAWALTGGCESEFLIKHKTYLETGAPVEVTYVACRYGSGPKMKVLLGESRPPEPDRPTEPLQVRTPDPKEMEAFLVWSAILLFAIIFIAIVFFWIRA